MGAHIKGTNGKSQGVVPFLKVANDTAVAVNQGGKERARYARIWKHGIWTLRSFLSCARILAMIAVVRMI